MKFEVVATASWLGLVRLLTGYGSAALAGYTLALRIIIVAILPSWGMSNAAATLVGQNLGAGHPERSEEAVWKACKYNAMFLGSLGLLFIVFAPFLIGIFTSETAVQPYAIACLRILAAGFVFYAYGMVVTQSFNGAGDTWTPTLINLGVFWVFELPLAWFLARHTSLGIYGVLADSVTSVKIKSVRDVRTRCPATPRYGRSHR